MHVRFVTPGHFAIPLLPVAVFLLNQMFLQSIGVPDLPVDGAIVRENVPHLEAPGRAKFLAGLWLFGLIVLVSLAALADALRRPMTTRSRVLALASLAAVVAPVAGWVAIHQSDPEAYRGYFQLGRDVYETALGQGVVTGCNLPTDRFLLGACGEAPALVILRQLLDVINLLSALGVGAVAVSMVLCLRRYPDGAPVEMQIELLRQNRAQMRKYLYLAGLMLSTGMFLALGWMHWPLPMIREDARADYELVLRGVEIWMGTFFSMLTLSFYLPVAGAMELRARRLAEEALGPEAPEGAELGWRKERALLPDQTQMIKEGLAVAAPVLTAFAGGFSPFG